MVPDLPGDVSDLLQKVACYLSAEDCESVFQAYLFAQAQHKYQVRDSGEPYIIHPVATASYLADMHMDAVTIMAALLHDVLEDTRVTFSQLERLFSHEVATLVDGATNLKKSAYKAATRDGWQFASLNKLLNASVSDIRVLLIKLADRLHNARTLQYRQAEKQERKALETLKFYAPLAARLGIWRIKTELESRSLEALEPAIYQEITWAIEKQIMEQADDFASASRLLVDQMNLIGLQGEVHRLLPQPYSYYQTMLAQNRPVSEIREILTIAVLVPTIQDCYTILGKIHGQWTPIPGKFDDYITAPKDNYYQSLHTTVVGPGGHLLKVRIRTYDMHERAEFGIFARWRYPERVAGLFRQDERTAWLEQLADLSRESATPQEFVDSLMSGVLPDWLRVFTPKGEVKELPIGATALDMAYLIHTHLGHASRAARVNGQFQQLNYRLRNGDMVEIIDVEDIRPCYSWLDPHLRMYVTPRAREAILRWFRRQPKANKLHAGEAIVKDELIRLGVPTFPLEKIASLFGRPDIESLYEAVGAARIRSDEIAERVLTELYTFPVQDENNGRDYYVLVGVKQAYSMAENCCRPLPGDQVIGLVMGDQVIVHRADCRKALRSCDDYRQVALAWQQRRLATVSIPVVVIVKEREGMLQDITAIIRDEHVNIADIHASFDRDHARALITAVLEVETPRQLVHILHVVDRLPNVEQARILTAEGLV